MKTQSIIRDERTTTVENASYRLAFLFRAIALAHKSAHIRLADNAPGVNLRRRDTARTIFQRTF